MTLWRHMTNTGHTKPLSEPMLTHCPMYSVALTWLGEDNKYIVLCVILCIFFNFTRPLKYQCHSCEGSTIYITFYHLTAFCHGALITYNRKSCYLLSKCRIPMGKHVALHQNISQIWHIIWQCNLKRLQAYSQNLAAVIIGVYVCPFSS